jgi:hypothetical protein
MASRPGQSLFVIERILRDRDGIWQQIIAERDLGGLTRQMLASSALSLAFYGAVLGASNSWAQALSSLVKLPLLFLATLAICLPTLYLFNLVFGARLSVMQSVTLIMVCVTVISVLTLAFAPISLFFLISAHNYSFFKLLNVAILVMTAIVGLRFLTNGMRALNAHQEAKTLLENQVPVADLPQPLPQPQPQPQLVAVGAEANGTFTAPDTNGTAPAPVQAPMPVPIQAPMPVHAPALMAVPGHAPMPMVIPNRMPAPAPAAAVAQRPASMTLLYIWILLFGFVGTQLAWTLRPFFGDPGQPFGLFRKIDGTFYADIFRTIGHLFGG